MRRESRTLLLCWEQDRVTSDNVTLGLSKKQARLHFQLWNFGSLRLLESSISFSIWHLLLFARTIKTFLFWSSRAIYHSAHVVCIAHTKIFWGLGNPFEFSDQCWLRNNGKNPWNSVAQNVLPLFWLTSSLSWGRGWCFSVVLVQIWSHYTELKAGVSM